MFFRYTFAGIFLGVIFAANIEKIRIFLSKFLKLEIFPSDVYFLEKLPSEINISSLILISVFSLLISAMASIIPTIKISKMKTFRALRYD